MSRLEAVGTNSGNQFPPPKFERLVLRHGAGVGGVAGSVRMSQLTTAWPWPDRSPCGGPTTATFPATWIGTPVLAQGFLRPFSLSVR